MLGDEADVAGQVPGRRYQQADDRAADPVRARSSWRRWRHSHRPTAAATQQRQRTASARRRLPMPVQLPSERAEILRMAERDARRCRDPGRARQRTGRAASSAQRSPVTSSVTTARRSPAAGLDQAALRAAARQDHSVAEQRAADQVRRPDAAGRSRPPLASHRRRRARSAPACRRRDGDREQPARQPRRLARSAPSRQSRRARRSATTGRPRRRPGRAQRAPDHGLRRALHALSC